MEADAWLDVEAGHLKELIAAVREGFKVANSRLNEISESRTRLLIQSTNLVRILFPRCGACALI